MGKILRAGHGALFTSLPIVITSGGIQAGCSRVHDSNTGNTGRRIQGRDLAYGTFVAIYGEPVAPGIAYSGV